MKKYIALSLLTVLLTACGGGGGSSYSAPVTPVIPAPPVTPVITSAAGYCAAPRPAGTINPDTNQYYGDVQGNLIDEMAWIKSFVNATYLWYSDVPAGVDSTSYVIGASVAYVDPYDNSQSTKKLTSNYDVVDAYFNTQRSPLTTPSGKPKDQFHFTYVTTDWQNLSSSGSVPGFGFQVIQTNNSGQPLQLYVAYSSPNTLAETNGMVRGTQFISVNKITVANAVSQTDYDTLNEALYSPVAGKPYPFTVQIPGQSSPVTFTMTTNGPITITPVMNVGTVAGHPSVGYILYTDQIATAEAELFSAITTLKTANGGHQVTDLVLDLRYNGGGLLELASELAYMIAGPNNTNGKFFERDSYNDKNPFGYTTAQATFPFQSTSLGFSPNDLAANQLLPTLNLNTVYVITTGGTCSASEAIMNGLKGAGVKVVQIGDTTCGKPYGFYPQDNCDTTYFTIQFKGVNNAGFGDYADGFSPAGTGTLDNNHLPGCSASDDLTYQLGDPAEGSLATALYYMNNNGTCPSSPLGLSGPKRARTGTRLPRSQVRENRIMPGAIRLKMN